MIIKKKCSKCGVNIDGIVSQRAVAGIRFVTYSPCSHEEMLPELKAFNYTQIISKDGKRLRPYQIDGVKFADTNQGRVLIADEMGVGKTWQAIAFLIAHQSEITKYAVIAKRSLAIQWAREIVRLGGVGLTPQIIDNENEYILPVKGYILSYDILAGTSHERTSKNGKKKLVTRGIQDLDKFIEKLDANVIIMDEVQHIKNHDSKRTQAVRKFARASRCVIGLSGTYIKNRASEAFPILNILNPARFPSFVHFDRKYLQTYWNGYATKEAGIKNLAAFESDTKDIVIRRTRKDVLPDLPAISRDTLFCDLGAAVEQAYIDTMKEFMAYHNDSGGDNAAQRSSKTLAYMSRMRHLAGLSKVEPAVEYIVDFLAETDRKLIVFVHHKDVAEILRTKLAQLAVDHLEIRSGLGNKERDDIIQAFRFDASKRVIICSTLAAGEGIDGLQVASDVLFIERQWNPANEEQAEGRIVRSGQEAQKLSGTYIIAVGTIDEFFAELVEKKRSIMAQVLDGQDIKWDQSSILAELADILAMSGGRKWGF